MARRCDGLAMKQPFDRTAELEPRPVRILDAPMYRAVERNLCIVTDWAPGAEASKVFDQHFIKGGGQVLDTLKVPLANPDFAPFLQRARDLQPDTLFVFVPAGQAGTLARQFAERGLDKSGIKLIGTS